MDVEQKRKSAKEERVGLAEEQKSSQMSELLIEALQESMNEDKKLLGSANYNNVRCLVPLSTEDDKETKVAISTLQQRRFISSVFTEDTETQRAGSRCDGRCSEYSYIQKMNCPKIRTVPIVYSNEEEWVEYQKTMENVIAMSGLDKSVFYDLRENHDNFGVPVVGGAFDYFSNYGITGQLGRSQSIVLLCRLRTHGAMKPFILSAHTQLSAMYPIYKLLDPRMRYTLEINVIGRQNLLNADCVIDQGFTLGCYYMEISVVAYKH